MKHVYILVDKNNEVIKIVKSEFKKEPWIKTSELTIPTYDTSIEGNPVLCWNGSQLYFRYDKIEEVPEEEYIPEIKNEPEYNISEKRRLAYEREADIYARAYLGYTLEGNLEKAEEAKQNYLEKKTEIRQQFPDQI